MKQMLLTIAPTEILLNYNTCWLAGFCLIKNIKAINRYQAIATIPDFLLKNLKAVPGFLMPIMPHKISTQNSARGWTSKMFPHQYQLCFVTALPNWQRVGFIDPIRNFMNIPSTVSTVKTLLK